MSKKAESFLPEDKWIYCTRNKQETDTGLWFYICNDEAGQNKPKMYSFITGRDTPSLDTNKIVDDKEQDQDLITKTVNIITDVDTVPTPIEILVKNKEDTYNNMPKPTGEPTHEKDTMTATDIIPKLLNNNEDLLGIDPPTSMSTTDIEPLIHTAINDKTSEEPDNTPKLGINRPLFYDPTICISSPKTDPEKKGKKRRHTESEYDPENPDIAKSHMCKKCDKSFMSKGSLLRHTQSNHSNESYQCEECGQKLVRKDSIKRHYRKYHPGISYPNHLIVNNNNTATPPKLVKFNVRSKSPVPTSQFAELQPTETKQKEPDNKKDEILNKILETLMSLKQ